MMRAEEPGWIKIGATCSAGRRSLWWRVNLKPTTRTHDDLTTEQRALLEEAGVDPDQPFVSVEDIVSIELCAGREGDDAYMKIENDGGRQFYDLWGSCSRRPNSRRRHDMRSNRPQGGARWMKK